MQTSYKIVPLVAMAVLPACTRSDCRAFDSQFVTAPNHAYAASVRKISCQQGAELQYTLIISVAQGSSEPQWKKEISLETDLQAEEAPTIRWESPARLIVEIPTRTITGTTTQHLGAALILEREYQAKAPGQFPNYY